MNLKQSQKTTVPAEKHLDKKWFLVDVKGKTLGPTAVKIANLLRGKEKTFSRRNKIAEIMWSR